jgi:hypothetical protein
MIVCVEFGSIGSIIAIKTKMQNMETKSISKITRELVMTKYRKVFWTLVALGILSAVLGTYLSFKSSGEFNAAFILLPIFGLLALYGFVSSMVRKKFFYDFAISIGFTYRGKALSEEFEGSLFNNGHSRHVNNLIEGRIDEKEVKIFDYSYTIGSGKNKTTYRFNIAEIVFKYHLPLIVLTEKTGFFNMTPDIDVEKNPVKLQLEGDFNKFFNLETEKEFEIEVLQIFTPDLMNDLCDKWKHLSLETTDDRLYIYENKMVDNTDELETFVKLAKRLISQIDQVGNSLSKDVSSLREAITRNTKQ